MGFGEGERGEDGRLHICPREIWGTLPTLTHLDLWSQEQWDLIFLGK